MSPCVHGKGKGESNREKRKRHNQKIGNGAGGGPVRWSQSRYIFSTFPYLGRCFLLTEVQQMSQGAACFITTLTWFIILSLCSFHFEEFFSLSSSAYEAMMLATGYVHDKRT